MEITTEDCKWYEYKCKFGETLFFYNTITGERRWPNQDNCSVDDPENTIPETEARDPPRHQRNEQGIFVRSLGTQTEDTTALEDASGMNITSIGCQTYAPKTYNSTGTETDINGVSGSRRLRALFNCALSVCIAEKVHVCLDDSVGVRSVAQTKEGDGVSYDICETRQLETQPNRLNKERHENLNISSLKYDVFKEQCPISHNATANVDNEDSEQIVKKDLMDVEELHQISCGFNYDEPVSNDINELELNNELRDGHHDTGYLEIISCVSGVSSGGAVEKKKSRNGLIERDESEVVVSHCLGAELETHSSERFDNRGREGGRSGVRTIYNSIQECESTPKCLDNNVTIGQVQEKDESVYRLTFELRDDPAEERSLEREECEELNDDINRKDLLNSVTDPENAVGHVEDETLSISAVPCCNDTIQNQEQSMTTEEGHFQCTQCEKVFTFRRNFGRHFRTHIEERTHECTQCDKVFKTRSVLANHLRIHTEVKPCKCTQCGKTFTRRSSLSDHLRIHTGERAYRCMQCDKAFKTRSNLATHLKTHSKERRYNCTQCKKTFKTQSDLTRHLRIHLGERPYKCTQCDKVFKTRSVLDKHLRIHTEVKTCKCTQCGKTFTRRSSLSDHLRIHTGERAYRCMQCDKTFKTRSNLTTHLKTHSKERRYNCTQCKKTFKTQNDLTRHLRIHLGERPYKCTQCDKVFKTPSVLDKHLRIHTEVKTCKCTQCGKTFTRRSSLSDHLRIHTGERAYRCMQCDKTFKTRSNLATHLPTHSDERLYNCTQCAKAFKRRSDLTTHHRIHMRKAT